MTTQLIFLRHAQALDKERGQTDFDRELSERGRRQARQVADYLADKLLFPSGMCLVSPAARTQQTFLLALGSHPAHLEPVFDQSLYDGSVADMEDLIYAKISDWATAGESDKVLAIVGHNPGISFLAERFGYAAGNSFNTATAVSILVPTGKTERLKPEKTIWRFDTD